MLTKVTNWTPVVTNTVGHKYLKQEKKMFLLCMLMNDNMKRTLKKILLFPVLFWTTLLLLIFVVILQLNGLDTALKLSAIYFLPLILPVYLHELVFERFFLKKKYLVYAILTIIIIGVLGFVIDLLEKAVYPKGDSSTIGAIIVFVLIYMGIKYLVLGTKQEFRLKELEAKQAQAELDLLKSQVNPHFLFNSLNSIYSLTLKNSPKSSEAVMLLSDLMRYILETSKMKFVFLKEELAFIGNYIELEKIRLGANFTLEYTITGEPENLYIAPMLLIAFVENVFKHGVGANESKNLFKIGIRITNDNLQFSCMNNIVLKNNSLGKKENQTGIENVRRRLELLYPGKHRLNIQKSENNFLVDLQIKLNY